MRAVINLYLTWKCNFFCDHCVHECGPQGNHMTPEQVDYAFQFMEWLRSRNIPIAIIGLTGGEPTLFPDFWEKLMPRVVATRQAHRLDQVELHTNASNSIPQQYKRGYSKFFSHIYVGHDICHQRFMPLKDLALQDYTEVSVDLHLRQNKYYIPSTGQEAIFVRLKGRAAQRVAEGKMSLQFWPNSGQLDCMWVKYSASDCLNINFTPDHVNHCGEKSHETPSEKPHGQFHAYGMDFNELWHKALDYRTNHCGPNCSQPCINGMAVYK